MNGLDSTLQMPVDGLQEGPRAPEPRYPAGAAISGDAPHSGQRFRDNVRQAYESRLQARRFVGTTLRDARLGRTIDAHGARERVEDLVTTIADDAGAALWLTNVREQDEYTSIHCVNVCVLTIAFGIHLGLQRHELVHLGMGALLHDIGKARTPTRILQKAGDLTPGEAAIVQRHPEDGYEILAASPRMPREALEVVRLHHERLGGHGYPFRLSGNEIPRDVRIAAIVDVYDTMTSDRPYRQARPTAQALQDLREHDTCFDSALVQEFIRCMGAFPARSVLEPDSHAMGMLAAERDRGDVVAARRIRRAVAPVTAGFNLLQCAG